MEASLSGVSKYSGAHPKVCGCIFDVVSLEPSRKWNPKNGFWVQGSRISDVPCTTNGKTAESLWNKGSRTAELRSTPQSSEVISLFHGKLAGSGSLILNSDVEPEFHVAQPGAQRALRDQATHLANPSSHKRMRLAPFR